MPSSTRYSTTREYESSSSTTRYSTFIYEYILGHTRYSTWYSRVLGEYQKNHIESYFNLELHENRFKKPKKKWNVYWLFSSEFLRVNRAHSNSSFHRINNIKSLIFTIIPQKSSYMYLSHNTINHATYYSTSTRVLGFRNSSEYLQYSNSFDTRLSILELVWYSTFCYSGHH